MKYAFLGFILMNLSAQAQLCRFNKDCDDGLFCNGVELCMPQARNANAKGCIPALKSPCGIGNACDEVANACRKPEPIDLDGDGHASVASGGDDCDDTNPQRYPGKAEVCDHIDDDCDNTTFGNKDSDQDGYIDAKCTNPVAGTDYKGGNDCDDTNPQIKPGAQICANSTSVNMCDNGGQFVTLSCGSNLKCYAQPNMLGICAP